MDGTVPVTPETKRGFRSWLGLFVQFAVLIALAVFGAAVASGGEQPGDYDAGLILCLAAIVLAFIRLKRTLDGFPPGLGDFMLVDDMCGLGVAVPVFVVLALVGLIAARAWDSGSLHEAGVALFVVSCVVVFLDLKRVFDHIDRRGW